MLYILSQNKSVIYSLNGMTMPALCTTTDREYSKRKRKDEREETVGKLYFDCGCCEDIGMFSTESIAKEILIEIWNLIKNAEGKDIFYEIPEYR